MTSRVSRDQALIAFLLLFLGSRSSARRSRLPRFGRLVGAKLVARHGHVRRGGIVPVRLMVLPGVPQGNRCGSGFIGSGAQHVLARGGGDGVDRVPVRARLAPIDVGTASITAPPRGNKLEFTRLDCTKMLKRKLNQASARLAGRRGDCAAPTSPSPASLLPRVRHPPRTARAAAVPSVPPPAPRAAAEASAATPPRADTPLEPPRSCPRRQPCPTRTPGRSSSATTRGTPRGARRSRRPSRERARDAPGRADAVEADKRRPRAVLPTRHRPGIDPTTASTSARPIVRAHRVRRHGDAVSSWKGSPRKLRLQREDGRDIDTRGAWSRAADAVRPDAVQLQTDLVEPARPTRSRIRHHDRERARLAFERCAARPRPHPPSPRRAPRRTAELLDERRDARLRRSISTARDSICTGGFGGGGVDAASPRASAQFDPPRFTRQRFFKRRRRVQPGTPSPCTSRTTPCSPARVGGGGGRGGHRRVSREETDASRE